MEHYSSSKEAFQSFNVSKNKKFNKRKAINILRKICKIVLKHKYENDPKELERYSQNIQRWEGYAKERNMSSNKKKKFIKKNVIKPFKKDIDDRRYF